MPAPSAAPWLAPASLLNFKIFLKLDFDPSVSLIPEKPNTLVWHGTGWERDLLTDLIQNPFKWTDFIQQTSMGFGSRPEKLNPLNKATKGRKCSLVAQHYNCKLWDRIIFVFSNYMNLLTMLLGMCSLTTEEKHVLEMKTWTQELHRTDLYSAQGRTSLTHLSSSRNNNYK